VVVVIWKLIKNVAALDQAIVEQNVVASDQGVAEQNVVTSY
jgi:hypothetical protein